MTALAPLLVALPLLLLIGAALVAPSLFRGGLGRSRSEGLDGRGGEGGGGLDLPLTLAACFATGLAVAAPLTFAAGIAGWPVGAWSFGLLLAVLAGGAWVLGAGGRVPGEGGLAGKGPAADRPLLRWTAATALALAAGVLLWKLLVVPVWSWDHFVIWGLKARRFAAAGSLDPGFLAEPVLARTSPHYPLGLPTAWLLLSLGTVPGAAAFKAAHLLFAAGLLASVRSAAARLGDSFAVGNAAAAFVALSPILWDTTTLGLADVPLAFFATTSVALMVAAADGREDLRPWIAAGLLAGFLPWIKDDGLPLALLLVALATAWTVGARWFGDGLSGEGRAAGGRSGEGEEGASAGGAASRAAAPGAAGPAASRRRGRGKGAARAGLPALAAFAVPALVLGAAAVLVERLLLPSGVEFLAGNWPRRLVDRLEGQAGEILSAMAGEMAAPGFLGLWLLFPLAVLLTLRRRHRRALPLALVVVVQLGLYLFVFFATALPPLDHVGSALYRIASALVPLAVLPVAALAAGGRVARTRKDGAERGRVRRMSPSSSQSPASGPFAFVRDFASRLRYPQLFFLTAGLFVADLLIPDLIPFADEILLGLLTLLLGRLKDRRSEDPREPRVKNVTPND